MQDSVLALFPSAIEIHLASWVAHEGAAIRGVLIKHSSRRNRASLTHIGQYQSTLTNPAIGAYHNYAILPGKILS